MINFSAYDVLKEGIRREKTQLLELCPRPNSTFEVEPNGCPLNKDHMADNTNQKRAEDVPQMQQSSLKISISPQLRQRVIAKIINTLRNRCRDPGMLAGVETIARKFEQKVLAIASDEQDYLRRITLKMKPLEGCSQKAVNSSIHSAASSDPNPLHSGNLQFTDIKHDQQLVESKNPSQGLPYLIINSSSPSHGGLHEPSFTTITPKIHASGSHSTSQNSDLLNISRIPPNLEKKDPKPQPAQLPYSQKAVSRQHRAEQSEVSSAYRHQSITKQQYESWQRDIAHQGKVISIPSQHKSVTLPEKHEASLEQSSTCSNQQNMLLPGGAPETPQEVKHHISQPSRVLSTGQPQRSMAQSRGNNEEFKQQTVQPHDTPLISKRESLGVWEAPTGFMSSQEERLHVQRISEQKPEVVREEKSSSFEVSSVSQDQSRPGIEATKRIDTSSVVERHGDPQVWHDKIHQRIMAMKKMYLPGLTAMDTKIDDKLKVLDTHPNDPTKDEISKKLKEAKVMVGRILSLLNIPKEEIMPVHGERLDNWQQVIVSYLSLFFKPKPPVPQLLPQSLPPDTHSPQVEPTEETCINGLNLHHVRGSQEYVASTSLLPTPRDVGDNCQSQAHDQKNSDLSPIQRLLKAVNSISPQALKSTMDDVFSVTRMVDMMESSAPKSTSKGSLGQDLGAMTGCRLQARNATLKWTQRPWLTENHLKRKRRTEPLLKLLSEEIRNVSQRLIDIEVHMCNEDSGTVVKCYYIGVSVDLSIIKCIKPSASSSLIQPLRMLIPRDYPDCPPILLDKLPSQSVDFCEDLSDKARARLDMCLRGLHSPFSVTEIARTWELCARAVIIEYAEKFGGGTFSSRYGNWDNCLDTS